MQSYGAWTCLNCAIDTNALDCEQPSNCQPRPAAGSLRLGWELPGRAGLLGGTVEARPQCTMACSRDRVMPFDRLHGQLSSEPSVASGGEFRYQTLKVGFPERGIFARRGQGGGREGHCKPKPRPRAAYTA